MKIINKDRLTEREVKYNFNTLLSGILITYNNEIFIVKHNIALDVLLRREVSNLDGILLTDSIFGYSIYQDNELSIISKLDDILYIMVGTIDDFKSYYISIVNKRLVDLDQLRVVEKKLTKFVENGESTHLVHEKYIGFFTQPS